MNNFTKVYAVSFLALLFIPSIVVITHATYVYKKGIVAGKGLALTKRTIVENGSLIEKEIPRWVEYNSDGDVVVEIDASYSSTVMSVVNQWNQWGHILIIIF